MENSTPRPDTINALRFGVDSALAMLAGMQLEVFTPLQHGAMTTEEIANAIGVAPTRLPLLLYALVAAGLLNEQDGRFSNTPETQHFLVKGSPLYMGGIRRVRSLANGVTSSKRPSQFVWESRRHPSIFLNLPQRKSKRFYDESTCGQSPRRVNWSSGVISRRPRLSWMLAVEVEDWPS